MMQAGIAGIPNPRATFLDGVYRPGIHNLLVPVSLNSAIWYPTMRYHGGDADNTNWIPFNGYGETLPQSGTDATYNVGSSLLGAQDDAFESNGNNKYIADNNAFGNISTNLDIYWEMFWKYYYHNSNRMFLSTVGPAANDEGWRIWRDGSQLKMSLKDVDDNNVVLATTGANFINTGWYFGCGYVNRDEASVNGSQLYLQGGPLGSGMDFSGVGDCDSAEPLTLCGRGDSAGGTLLGESIALISVYHGADMIASGAGGKTEMDAFVAERFSRLTGRWTDQNVGTTKLPTIATRDDAVYLEKIESGKIRYFLVGRNHIRTDKKQLPNGQIFTSKKIEAQVTNLLVAESEDLSLWTKVDAGDIVATEVSDAPDGRTVVGTIKADATDGQHGLTLDKTLTAVTYTLSAFAEPDDKNWVKLEVSSIANCWCYFNLTPGSEAVGTAGAAAVGYIIPNFKEGLTRFCIVHTGTAALHTAELLSAHDDNDDTFAGDGAAVSTSWWGMQWEAGEYMSSPIIEIMSGVARAADALRYKGDDGNITDNQQGTMQCETFLSDYDHDSLKTFVALSDGGALGDRIFAYVNSTDGVRVQSAASVGNTGLSTLAVDPTDGEKHLVKARWAIDNLVIQFDDDEDNTPDTDCGMPDDIDRIDIGRNQAGANYLNDSIGQIKIYDHDVPYATTRVASAKITTI